MKKPENTDKIDWAKEIARKFLNTIPLFTKLPKDDTKIDKKFRTLAKFQTFATQIVFNHNTRFKTIADVDRAAHHIGMMILYKMFGELGTMDGAQHAATYNMLKLTEQYHANNILIDDTVNSIRHIVDAHNNGIIKPEKMNSEIDKIIDTLPDDIQDAARFKIQQMQSGANVSSLMNCSLRGGDRKSNRG